MVATLLAAIAVSSHVRLLPGRPTIAAPDAWPRFLFLFRGVHGDFRLQEVRAVAEMLGFGEQFSMEPVGASSSESMAANRQQYVRFDGGDVGPAIFQFVSLPDATAAEAVASRCVLVRGAYDVWASADFGDDSDAHGTEVADERWKLLADAVCASDLATQRAMLDPLGPESWKMDITTFGTHKPYSLSKKVALFELFHDLLVDMPGEVELKTPEQVVSMVEDVTTARVMGPANGGMQPVEWEGWQWQSTAQGGRTEVDAVDDASLIALDGGASDGGASADAPPHAPRRLFLARKLSDGAGGLLWDFSLRTRRFIGRTSLPADLAFLMANQAHVGDGSLVLDPFCGTASTLLSCARFGASVVGLDIDERTFSEAATSAGERGSSGGVRSNFAQASLPPPEALLVADATRLLGGDDLLGEDRYFKFDAIVTDPPYGLLEGLGLARSTCRSRSASPRCSQSPPPVSASVGRSSSSCPSRRRRHRPQDLN